MGFFKDYYLSPVLNETEELETRRTNGTSKNGRCSDTQTRAIKATERAWKDHKKPERVKSCSGVVFRALSEGSYSCSACNSDLQSTFHPGNLLGPHTLVPKPPHLPGGSDNSAILLKANAA